MADNSSFDARVERFLKGMMSPEEENAFKSELHSDSDKLRRAQTIALAIKQMQHAEKNADADFISDVSGMSEADIERLANNPYEDFDYQVDRFLRNQMTVDEESAFKSLLNSSKELQERAHAIALAIDKMREDGRQKDLQIIEAIKDTDINVLKKLVGIKPRVNWLKVLPMAASVLLVLGFGITFFWMNNASYGPPSSSTAPQAINLECPISMEAISRSPEDSISLALMMSRIEKLETNGSQEIVEDLISDKETYENEQYSAFIDWKIAVYYIKKDQPEKAKYYFTKIVKEHNDEPIAKKAKYYLHQLE